MGNQKNIQKKISQGISGWLLFEFHCLRGYVFSEKYIAYPLSQILNSITDYTTLAEVNHPYGIKSGRGRPLQVDFVLSDTKGTWQYAFETKWIGNTTISLGSLIWDLIRLQNLFNKYPKMRCYFVLAGFEKKIAELFEKKTFNICYDPSTKESELTTVKKNSLKFDLTGLDRSSKDYINEKISSYSNFTLYSRIDCKPAHAFPERDVVNMTFTTYTFEVLPPESTLKIKSL